MLNEVKLRQPCSPDCELGGGDEHRHLCKCGTCWKHDGDEARAQGRKAFKLAHTCPNCGTEVRQIHWTRDELAGSVDETIELLKGWLAQCEERQAA